jgi:hypothetical protein
MATLRDSLLPVIQRFRDLSVEFGVRQYQVWLRTITWTGTRVGLGTSTTTDTYLGKPKFRRVSSKDVIAGSVMSEQLFEIGPFTPSHSGSSSTPDTLAVLPTDLSPDQTGTPTEIYYVVKGPGLPTDGALFERVMDSLERPFRYMVTIKSIGRGA